MHVVVTGAGIAGVTTAWYLAQQGCRVTVVERADAAAAGSSHANGGQLSYSFTDALARPSFIARLPGLLAGMDRASEIRFAPALAPWGLRFLAQCRASRSRENTLALLRLALRSATLMAEMRARLPVDYDFRPSGKIVLLSSEEELQRAREVTALKKAHGCDVELLTREEALSVEPALDSFSKPIIAAVYSKQDEVGDTRRFVQGLADHLEREHDVQFRYSTTAERLRLEDGRVTGIDCGESLAADAVVVSLGAWSGTLLREVGVNPRIYPVRGYSVTLPPGPAAPAAGVTSQAEGFVCCRLNGAMRIAGFADFRGYDTSRDEARIKRLLDTARQVAPLIADYDHAERQPWGGFRPMTPDGLPLAGPTKVGGLYLNTGHGMLGWTLAAATAQSVAKSITGNHAHA